MHRIFLLVLAFLGLAAAQGGTSNYTVDGVWYDGYV
jgi:hypothetical protein